jgi:hypothetical protein
MPSGTGSPATPKRAGCRPSGMWKVPAGEGLTTMTSRVLRKAWTLGAARDKPWVGTSCLAHMGPSGWIPPR